MRGPRLLLAGILVLAAILRVAGLSFSLPAVYRPDEDTLLGRAAGVAKGELDPHFFDWPSLMFYLDGAVLRIARPLAGLLGGGRPCAPEQVEAVWCWPASDYLAGRLLTALVGCLTVALAYCLAKRAYGERAALIGAAFLAVAFLHVRDSHFATIDVPLSLATLTVLWLAQRMTEPESALRVEPAGVALGMAAGIKYNGALAGAALLAAQAVRGLQGSAAKRRVLALAVVAAATFVASTPFALLHPLDFQSSISYIFGHLARPSGLPVGWIYLPTFVLPLALGIPVFLLAAAGTVRAVFARTPTDLTLLAFLAAYFAVIGSGHFVFVRYADPLLPPLCILAGRALAEGLARVRLPAAAAAALAIGVSTAVGAESALRSMAFDAVIGRTDTRTLAYAWAQAHLPTGSRVLMPYYAGFMHDAQAERENFEHTRSRAAAPYLQNRFTDRLQIVDLSRDIARDWTWDDLVRARIDYVVWGTPRPSWPSAALLDRLWERGPAIACFRPGGRTRPVVDPLDSYYVPLAGFTGVARPGPDLWVFAVGTGAAVEETSSTAGCPRPGPRPGA